MGVRDLAFVCVGALTFILPARGDIVLGYRIGSPPSGNDPTNPLWIDNQLDPINGTNQPVALGTPITGPLVLTLGQTVFLQVTIQTNANVLSSPTPTFSQAAWTNANRMITFALGLNYPFGIVNNPIMPPIPFTDPDQNNANARAVVPFATGMPTNWQAYATPGQRLITGATTSPGIGAIAGQMIGEGNERAIAVFRLSAVDIGSGTISLFDLNVSPTAEGFSLQGGQNLDEYVFHLSHGTYSLPVTVVPVPEPSSMALAGLALAGIGWRKWRRQRSIRP